MPPFHLLSEGWLMHLAATYGAWAVFVSVAVESTGIPVPSESILIAVALLAAGGDAAPSILAVVPAAAAGAVLGDNLGYALGRGFGPPLLARMGLGPARQRLGRYLSLRYGGRIVFVARFVSVLRTCVSLLAGANRMPWRTFLAYNALGALAWSCAIGFGAYALGERMRAWSWAASLALGAAAAIVLAAGAVILKRKERTLQAEADAALPEGA